LEERTIIQSTLEDNLYFIAIIPENKVSNDISKEKESFSNTYHSKYALKTMPHITIIPPFKCSHLIIEQVIKRLSNINYKNSSFDIHLKDYKHFNESVIFIDVIRNNIIDELVQQLKDSLKNLIKISSGRYHPHITIAFRDLSQSIFEEAWKKYRNKKYTASFPVNNIYLLKHIDQKWQILEKFNLGKDKTIT